MKRKRRTILEKKQLVKKQFSRRANAYVDSKMHRKGKDLFQLLEMAHTTGKEKLLDVATGGGHTANVFAPHVQEVVAMDLTPEMLQAAKNFIKENGHTNVTFVEGDAEKMPFPNSSFDIVTCRIAPHHFPHVEKFLQEVYRILKPNGQFLLDDNVSPEDDELDRFYNEMETIRDPSHIRAYKKSEWIKMIELTGFVIDRFSRFNKKFEFKPWCERMNLSEKDQKKLTNFIVNSPEKVKRKFQIKVSHNQIESFYGEALLLKAIKESNCYEGITRNTR